MQKYLRQMFRRDVHGEKYTYRIHPEFSKNDLDDLSNRVRDEGVDFLIGCERIFQKAMRIYKLLVIEHHSGTIENRRVNMKRNPNQFQYSEREMEYWNAFVRSKDRAY